MEWVIWNSTALNLSRESAVWNWAEAVLGDRQISDLAGGGRIPKKSGQVMAHSWERLLFEAS